MVESVRYKPVNDVNSHIHNFTTQVDIIYYHVSLGNTDIMLGRHFFLNEAVIFLSKVIFQIQ